MDPREGLREAFGLGVDDEVHVPLTVKRDPLRAVPRDRGESHLLEQRPQLGRVGSGVLDELEAVGTHWIVDIPGHSRLLSPPAGLTQAS